MEENEIKTVEMVRAIRDHQYERTKNMTIEEKIAYYQAQAQIVMEQVQPLITKKKRKPITA